MKNIKDRIAETTILGLTSLLGLDAAVLLLGICCDEAGEDRLGYFVFCGIIYFALLSLYLLCSVYFYFRWRISFCNNRVIRSCSYIFDVLTVGLLLLFCYLGLR